MILSFIFPSITNAVVCAWFTLITHHSFSYHFIQFHITHHLHLPSTKLSFYQLVARQQQSRVLLIRHYLIALATQQYYDTILTARLITGDIASEASLHKKGALKQPKDGTEVKKQKKIGTLGGENSLYFYIWNSHLSQCYSTFDSLKFWYL